MAISSDTEDSTPRWIWRYTFHGLLVILPLLVTIQLLVWLLGAAESWLGPVVLAAIPDDWYLPGMGIVLFFAVAFGVGLLTRYFLMQRLIDYGERLITRIPLISSLYSTIRDFASFISDDSLAEQGHTVLVDLPQLDATIVGIVTVDGSQSHGYGNWIPQDHVLVFLPMSYQVGGYTLNMPRERVTPIDLPVTEAMKFTLTAGIGTSEDFAHQADKQHGRTDEAESANQPNRQ